MLSLKTFGPVLQRPRIFHRVLSSYGIRNTLAVQYRLSIKTEHGGAEFCVKSVSIGHTRHDRRHHHHRHGRRARHRHHHGRRHHRRIRETQSHASPLAGLR